MAKTPDVDPSNVHVTGANDKAVGPLVCPMANLLGFLQFVLGLFGVFGVFLYLIEPKDNHSRYQLLILPFWTFIFAIPLLVVAAFLYRRCRSNMSLAERYLFNIGCTLPLLAFAFSIAVPYFAG